MPPTLPSPLRIVRHAGRTMPALLCAATLASVWAGEPAAEVRTLADQNRRLQQQVEAQQRTIDDLSSKLGRLLQASERHEQELRGLRDQVDGPAAPSAPAVGRGQEIRISAEAGVAFFQTGREGQFPQATFRVDDPMIALEAPVARNTYFFAELKLLTRETNVEDFELGELYVDFENFLGEWDGGSLSLRAGRLNIPFGEEYLVRTPVANPLISHSLSDIWGVDEGVEIYGRIGRVRYIAAVQNGGVSRLRDFNSDKAFVGRLSWEPVRWLRLSGSAMRTGELASVDDNLSEVWFGNGFFRALGPSTSTPTFWASLYEGDARASWRTGHVSGALGEVKFDDSDPAADHARRLRYGYLEMVQRMTARIYGAARYSEIQAPRGYPLPGWGRMGTFFFRPVLTRELRRLSLGLGYRLIEPVVFKVEYTWESGRMTTGAPRDHENFFGSEIAVKF